jgi:PAS domain S-box-containing protein
MQLKLTHTLILLIGIPLMAELAFVSTLVYSLRQAEQDYEREARSRDRVMAVNNLLTYYLTLAGGIGVKMSNWNRAPHAAFNSEMETTIKNLDYMRQRLAEQAKKDPDIARDISTYGDLLDQLVVLAREQQVDVDTENTFRYAATLARASRLNGLMNNRIKRALLTEEEVMRKQRSVTIQKRTQLEQIILGGVLLNVAVAMILGLYLKNAISNRLATLMRNNYLLAAGKPLEPRIEGSDELAEIDRTFHLLAVVLQEAHHREQALIENADDVICSLDQKGKFISVSAASREKWGYEPDELIGRSLTTLAQKTDDLELINSIINFSDGQVSKICELSLQRKDGTRKDMLWSVRWSDTENSIFCVVHDITERKEIERMKQEFLSMVSHDMRSPLSSVELALSMIAEGCFGDIDDQGAMMVTNAEASVSRLVRMINDLLDLDRLESGAFLLNKVPCSIDEIIIKSVQTIQNFADKHQVRINCVPSNINAKVDAERLLQVIVNLLTNAVKFSPQNSNVKVEAKQKNDVFEILISDQGRGIPAAELDTVFDRFRQVDKTDSSKHKGTGLGLAICKRIIEEHGGSINVQSREGYGSTFTIQLPVSG